MSQGSAFKVEFSRSEVFLITSIVLGLLHHLDHVLRADRSGYPFTSVVTPLTWSLLAYPILLSALLIRSFLWYRVVAVLSVFLFTQIAHIFLETPFDQYSTWADGISRFPDALGQPNLLHIASPVIGLYAVILSLALSVSLIITSILLVQEAWSHSHHPNDLS